MVWWQWWSFGDGFGGCFGGGVDGGCSGGAVVSPSPKSTQDSKALLHRCCRQFLALIVFLGCPPNGGMV